MARSSVPKRCRQLLDTHVEGSASATLATAVIPDPTGYGRIVRDTEGVFQRIVEHKDASEDELTLDEVNPSYYCFHSGSLFEQLARISNDNAGGEYYLTDVFTLLLDAQKHVAVVAAVPPEDVLSINTLDDLAKVEGLLLDRSSPPNDTVQRLRDERKRSRTSQDLRRNLGPRTC